MDLSPPPLLLPPPPLLLPLPPPLLLLLLLLGAGGLFGHGGQPLGPDPLLQQPYDLLYASGLREYQRGRWAEAARWLERSLLGHSALRRLRARCRARCARGPAPPPDPPPAPPRRWARRLLERAGCLRHCLGLALGLGGGSRHRVDGALQADFARRAAYNYLQLAYYRLKQLDKAAAAAQTFFEANPDHQEMQENMEIYRKMEGVTEEDFVDLEAQPHWVAYEEGLGLYETERFAESIPHLEAAVRGYLVELEECRAQCEGPYNASDYTYRDYQSHLYEAISSHYVQVLSCYQSCVGELATKPGRAVALENFLPSHFYLLQAAYYKVGDYAKAVECSRTFLLFLPEDGTMLQNLAFYRSKLPVDRAAEILPREDIKDYIEQSLLQKQMLYFIMETQGVPFTDPDSWTPAGIVPEVIRDKLKAKSLEHLKVSPEATNKKKTQSPKVEDAIQILKASSSHFANLQLVLDLKALTGSQRVILDGALTPMECAALRSFANAAADVGDSRSGHTSALTIRKSLELALQGALSRQDAHLYHQVSERARTIAQAYFRSEPPLHPSSSHLHCRSPPPATGDRERGEGPSAPVPGGECLRDPEDTACWRESEAEADGETSYRVFLYLNDEFEGGEFYIMDRDGEKISREISPKCGRFLSFLSGSGNPYGVKPVTSGQRCAIALHFTQQHEHNEEERVGVARLLEQLYPPVLPAVQPRQASHPQDHKAAAEGSLAPDAGRQGELGLPPKGKQKKQKTKKKKTGRAADRASGSIGKDEL
ncbi:prolyl 3-hydroxylase 1-like [Carcharodon carcharias]|uniref:prolyl 3-hydroxylase 1-like n=1 Tax=Carcharodon carcharias TaxID=13397 RepID=UPI001B7E52FE|nr:prolyl 3-hydroxylase 1-like [Carcharodon carcharias]